MRIANATLPDGSVADVRIDGSQIVAVGTELEPQPREGRIDATGLRLMPGGIDVHVHFRDPGMTYKEDWDSGTASAAAGGVTTVVDQPNTDPPTISAETFDHKQERATAARIDYGINGGVTEEWDPTSLFTRDIFALGEVFLADSTGDMGIEQSLFEEALDHATAADVPVTVHAEDEREFDTGVKGREDPLAWSEFRRPAAEISAVERVVETTTEAQLHIAHASVPEAVDRASKAGITCEVTPHHLFLSTDHLSDLGTVGRMNPPLRPESMRQGMWERLLDGRIAMVATDHAPHTREEKEGSIWEVASGVPGVETMLPLLCAAAERDEITYTRIAEVTAKNPADRFGLVTKGRIEPGYDADLALFDPEPTPIDPDSLHSACTWSPFAGWEGVFPVLTVCRGRVVYEGGTVGNADGRNVRATT